jgi:hypothetical protein
MLDCLAVEWLFCFELSADGSTLVADTGLKRIPKTE